MLERGLEGSFEVGIGMFQSKQYTVSSVRAPRHLEAHRVVDRHVAVLVDAEDDLREVGELGDAVEDLGKVARFVLEDCFREWGRRKRQSVSGSSETPSRICGGASVFQF